MPNYYNNIRAMQALREAQDGLAGRLGKAGPIGISGDLQEAFMQATIAAQALHTKQDRERLQREANAGWMERAPDKRLLLCGTRSPSPR